MPKNRADWDRFRAMAIVRTLGKLLLGVALMAPVAVIGTACGPKEPAVVKAKLKPGNMPADGAWRGVYYDTVFGFLHLEKDGSNVSGAWRTEAGDKWGELHGTAEGNILRFEWTEHRIGMFGPSATTNGKGYFRYVVPPGDNIDHKLEGEWGLGDSDAGNPWNAIKQRNMQPDLNSVRPDENQTTFEGGDWDGSKSPQSAGAQDKDGDGQEDMDIPEGAEEGEGGEEGSEEEESE